MFHNDNSEYKLAICTRYQQIKIARSIQKHIHIICISIYINTYLYYISIYDIPESWQQKCWFVEMPTHRSHILQIIKCTEICTQFPHYCLWYATRDLSPPPINAITANLPIKWIEIWIGNQRHLITIFHRIKKKNQTCIYTCTYV